MIGELEEHTHREVTSGADGFGEPEVGNFDFGRGILCQEDVFGLEVAVHDALAVYVL